MYKRIVTNGVLNGIVRLSDNACIPLAEDNSDYQNFVKWLEENNTKISDLPADIYDNRKEIKLNELNNQFQNALAGGVIYNGAVFNSDPYSQTLINNALACHERNIPVFPEQWILKDGNTMEVNYNDLLAVSALIVQRVRQCYTRFGELKAAIMTLDDPSQLDLTQGWPI